MKIVDIISYIDELIRTLSYSDKRVTALLKLKSRVIDGWDMLDIAPVWMEHAVEKWRIDIKRSK